VLKANLLVEFWYEIDILNIMKIGYARVSTLEQVLDLQEDALKKVGCSEIFIDRISGSVKERPGLKEALKFLREGDTLVTWRLDRLARSLKDLIAFINTLKEKGIHFQSLTENIETESMTGRFIFHIFGALAEFERDLIQTRTKAGLASARARGKLGGRPPLLSSQQQQKLNKLINDSNFTIEDLQDMFKISKTSLYRYIKAAKPEEIPC
jgi:DNA invertase Pin-like site-specific DNA recombinase